MALYKSKPTTIEAEQFTNEYRPIGVCIESHAERMPDFLLVDDVNGAWPPHVHTKQGQLVKVGYGEWIIKESDGSGYYPCAKDVFEKRWELTPTRLTKVDRRKEAWSRAKELFSDLRLQVDADECECRPGVVCLGCTSAMCEIEDALLAFAEGGDGD